MRGDERQRRGGIRGLLQSLRRPRPGMLERRVAYSPRQDRYADPGEIVWTWIAFEEGDGRGKDRPVLVVGGAGRRLLVLMLSSNPQRQGQRHWHPIGPGPWDREHRPSWVRLDRAIVVPRRRVRRIGAVLAWNRFEPVAARLRTEYGWL